MNIRIIQLEALRIIGASSAIGGIAAIIIGGGACIGGLGATGAIKLGEFLSPNRPTIRHMMFYGASSVGAGLFLILSAAGIAAIGEVLADKELKRINNKIEESRINFQSSSRVVEPQTTDEIVPNVVNEYETDDEDVSFSAREYEEEIDKNYQKFLVCNGCKHWHGKRYGKNFLICAMHPYGWEKDSCPDREVDD